MILDLRKSIYALTFAVIVFQTSGQDITSSLRVNVSDAAGAQVADATVAIQSRTSGFRSQAQRDGPGRYFFPSVPIGDYIVIVTKNGFAESHPRVVLTDPSPARINVQLQAVAKPQAPSTNSNSVDVVGHLSDIKRAPRSVFASPILRASLIIWFGLGTVGWIVAGLNPDTRTRFLLALLFGPLLLLYILNRPHNQEHIGWAAGLSLLVIAAALAYPYLGLGGRDWTKAELILYGPTPGDISEIMAAEGPPDRRTPAKGTTPGECYWWDEHGLLVSETGSIVGTCFFVASK